MYTIAWDRCTRICGSLGVPSKWCQVFFSIDGWMVIPPARAPWHLATQKQTPSTLIGSNHE